MLILPRTAIAILLFLYTAPSILTAQANTVWSFAPDLAILLNKEGTGDYGFGYLVEHAGSNLEFGFSALRRLYPIRPSRLSYEYGLRVQKAFVNLRVGAPQTSGRERLSLDRYGVSIPLRIFYGGKGAFTDRRGRQSGIFAELLLSGYTGDDLLRNVYSSHLSFGARTRGRRVYFQLSFGWPLYTSETQFTFRDRGFAYTNRERRFGLLTIGYQLQN
jgi:hypothetical protein